MAKLCFGERGEGRNLQSRAETQTDGPASKHARGGGRNGGRGENYFSVTSTLRSNRRSRRRDDGWMDRQTPSAAIAVRRFFPSPPLTSKLPLMYAGQENQQCQRKRERENGGGRKGKRKIGLNWSLMAAERREREREREEWKTLDNNGRMFLVGMEESELFSPFYCRMTRNSFCTIPFPSFFGPCADAFMLQQSRRRKGNIFNLSSCLENMPGNFRSPYI